MPSPSTSPRKAQAAPRKAVPLARWVRSDAPLRPERTSTAHAEPPLPSSASVVTSSSLAPSPSRSPPAATRVPKASPARAPGRSRSNCCAEASATDARRMNGTMRHFRTWNSLQRRTRPGDGSAASEGPRALRDGAPERVARAREGRPGTDAKGPARWRRLRSGVHDLRRGRMRRSRRGGGRLLPEERLEPGAEGDSAARGRVELEHLREDADADERLVEGQVARERA